MCNGDVIHTTSHTSKCYNRTVQSSSDSPSYLGLYIAAVGLALLGWGGLAYLIIYIIPTIGPRWLFFALWVVALTGTSVPFAHYLNRRFAGRPAPANVLLRQATWVGVFGATLAWLQLGRALNWANGLLLMAGLIAIEWFLELREKSKWSPTDDDRK